MAAAIGPRNGGDGHADKFNHTHSIINWGFSD
ncbi:hypothetical protein GBAR_LOCUS11350 [Geodia barretti]|uniref:Uncharacterized protein n=1 Tax=Geodia barretti TaxID=519541 RepID=A0AA35WIU8_GEOBA|nr:hypothetical protein GBAR_LOCUS11350 [Geodia barretti]